jgi:hypothetical protein
MAMGDMDLRVGDRDRDDVARSLRQHCAAGRLSMEEFDQRVEAAYRAITRRELLAVTSDLPAEDPPTEGAVEVAPQPEPSRVFWPGVTPFHEERYLRASCSSSFDSAQREMIPRMGMQGFHVVEEIRPRRLRFVRGSGLMVTVMFHPAADGGTIVTAFGHAPRAVRKAFATLRD